MANKVLFFYVSDYSREKTFVLCGKQMCGTAASFHVLLYISLD